MPVTSLIILIAPLMVLLALGFIAAARQQRPPWSTALALVVVSTAVWLVYVGLFQHEAPCDSRTTGCPTVYGYDAPLPDEHLAGVLLLVGGFAVPAAWVGWRCLAPALTTGAALAFGPTLLAWWTAPRGDGDGLWLLILWYLPALGGLAALVTAVAERISTARRGPEGVGRELANASPSDRLAALAIDVAIIGAALLVPLTALSHAKLEVLAALLGVGAATAYLAVPLAWKGRTLGQSLTGLFVLDHETGRPVSAPRAVLRSVIVVLEVAAVPTLIFAVPALIEWLSLAGSGRTVTDRVLGTVVLSERRSSQHASSPGASGSTQPTVHDSRPEVSPASADDDL